MMEVSSRSPSWARVSMETTELAAAAVPLLRASFATRGRLKASQTPSEAMMMRAPWSEGIRTCGAFRCRRQVATHVHGLPAPNRSPVLLRLPVGC